VNVIGEEIRSIPQDCRAWIRFDWQHNKPEKTEVNSAPFVTI
jgi:hypothetical protein